MFLIPEAVYWLLGLGVAGAGIGWGTKEAGQGIQSASVGIGGVVLIGGALLLLMTAKKA